MNWSNSCLSGSWTGVHQFWTGSRLKGGTEPEDRGEHLNSEVVTQVQAPDLRIVDDVVLTALHQHLAGIDDVGPVGEGERLADIVVGDKYADTAIGQTPDKPLDLDHCLRINAGERFVEQHVIGAARQRPGDLDPATFATRQRDGRRLAMPRDLELFEQRVEIVVAAATVGLHHFEHRADIVLDIKATEDRRFLREIADPEAGPLIHGKMRDVVPVELDLAALRLDQAGDHVERGGLARTIRPQQAHRLTAADIEADAIDHPASAIAFLEIMRGQVALRALLAARGGILAWTRLGWRCLGGDGSTGRRNRPAQGGQIHALRAAVGFSCPSRRAAVPKQREDVEHASALEAPGVQLRRPVPARNPTDWNGSDRLVNPLPRWGLRACRSRTCARRRWPHPVGS